jgi:DNA replication licensing factor MCM5
MGWKDEMCDGIDSFRIAQTSQLEAIVRLSESLAKMRLSQQATEEDVDEALRLFKYSTIDAIRTGQSE